MLILYALPKNVVHHARLIIRNGYFFSLHALRLENLHLSIVYTTNYYYNNFTIKYKTYEKKDMAILIAIIFASLHRRSSRHKPRKACVILYYIRCIYYIILYYTYKHVCDHTSYIHSYFICIYIFAIKYYKLYQRYNTNNNNYIPYIPFLVVYVDRDSTSAPDIINIIYLISIHVLLCVDVVKNDSKERSEDPRSLNLYF